MKNSRNSEMNKELILKAASQFAIGECSVQVLGHGLIHRTFLITFIKEQYPIVLQCINQQSFSQPENIITNYRIIYNHLNRVHPGTISIPEPLSTIHGHHFYIDEEGNFWRATVFTANSYSISLVHSAEEIKEATRCFARLTKALAALELDSLNVIIPGFHDLTLRYHQFEEAIKEAGMKRLLRSTHVIAELRQRFNLVLWYGKIQVNRNYPQRLMHHDCKISNILFDSDTQLPITPVDLDTVMPGHFFSDIGDMIRTMCVTEDENSVNWEKIDIDPILYNTVVTAYREEMDEELTEEEKNDFGLAGPIMVFMQCLRYVTDYLKNDIYYRTSYPEQNLNRALNQLVLLEKLEVFLEAR